MNKKYLYIFCAVGFSLVALVAAMLIGSAGGWTNTMKKAVYTNITITEMPEKNNGVQEQMVSGQNEQTGVDENASTFEVAFGIGDRSQMNAEPAIQAEQNSQGATNPASTRPTQTQNTPETQPLTQGENGKPEKLMRYEEFLALSNAQQQAYFDLFEDPLEYARWLQQAQQAYESEKNSIVVTGPVDLSTLPVGSN